MTNAESISPLIAEAAKLFGAEFGRRPRFVGVAPGRLNLIGEHTDYNDGFVLPIAMERWTVVVADLRASAGNPMIHLATTSEKTRAAFSLQTPAISKPQADVPHWAQYVRGVVACCREAGLNTGPFDALIHSDVPVGAGLSSSAALEVATATLIEALTGQRLEPWAKALLCQSAEHRYAGVPCGIMDQFISTFAEPGKAMLLDCRTRDWEMVPLDDPDLVLLVCNTNVRHSLAAGEYGQRGRQCIAAAKALGVPSLRDVTMEQLQAAQATLDPLLYRRVRHVVSEMARTRDAASCMREGDWKSLGQLMYRSHESLRDDFAVSCPELNVLVEGAAAMGETGGVLGARMTGGGFGGCALVMVHAAHAQKVAALLGQYYRARTGIEATIFPTRAAGGAHAVAI